MGENQDPASKLEQDYIQMFLGKLEPMQESRLVQLKQCMAELQKDKAPTDPVVLRFLRARDFNVEKAREMLSSSLVWRKKHGVDKILSEYQVGLNTLYRSFTISDYNIALYIDWMPNFWLIGGL